MSDDDAKNKLQRSGTALESVRGEYACPKGHRLVLDGMLRKTSDEVIFVVGCAAFQCMEKLEVDVHARNLELATPAYLVGWMRAALNHAVAARMIIRVVAEGL